MTNAALLDSDEAAEAKADQFALPEGFTNESAFLADIRERFQQASDADRANAIAAREDLQFLSGEQWDPAVKAARIAQGRPCLEINRLPQFVGQVVGDIRQNKPSIKVRAVDDDDEEAADTRQGLIRSIEEASGAPNVYALAGEDQVGCGIGWFRVDLEYADDDVFDQNIVINPGGDPLAVVWDPLSLEPTGADAKFCFVTDTMPQSEFKKRWPGQTPGELDSTLMRSCVSEGWWDNGIARITEYWFVKETPKKLGLLQDGSVVDVDDPKAKGQKFVKERMGREVSVCRYLVTGHAILEGPYELPLPRLPIIRVMGREVRIGDRRVRYGLIRFAKDAMRLLNWARSILVEQLAKAPKNQWLASASSVEGYEDDFRRAASSGDPLLIHGDGQAPTLAPPPPFPAAYAELAALHAQDLKDVTGLHDASLGAQSNETSGKAILARERQGDTATFMYTDNLHLAVEAGGKVVNALIPIAYDTPRTLLVTGEDGGTKPQRVNDPTDENSIDLTGGKYHVTIDVGPSFATKRVEAAESMMQFVQAFPQAAPLVGDLVAKAQDWPMAEDFAERLQAILPPQIKEMMETKENGGQPPPPQPPSPQDVLQEEMGKATLAEAQAKALRAHSEVDGQELKNRLVQAQIRLADAEAEQALFAVGQLHGAAEAVLNADIVNSAEPGEDTPADAQGDAQPDQPAPEMVPPTPSEPPAPAMPAPVGPPSGQEPPPPEQPAPSGADLGQA